MSVGNDLAPGPEPAGSLWGSFASVAIRTIFPALLRYLPSILSSGVVLSMADWLFPSYVVPVVLNWISSSNLFTRAIWGTQSPWERLELLLCLLAAVCGCIAFLAFICFLGWGHVIGRLQGPLLLRFQERRVGGAVLLGPNPGVGSDGRMVAHGHRPLQIEAGTRPPLLIEPRDSRGSTSTALD